MPKKYNIISEQIKEITEARKTIKDKTADRRLRAVQLRGEGLSDKEIAERLETTSNMISYWVRLYVKEGLKGLLPKKRKGNHRNMTFQEEEEFLSQFKEKAKLGEIVEVSEIKKAYAEKIGFETKSHGHIYEMLKRHGWRKVMPRSRHPKKASDEAIKASKKLKPR